MSFKIEKPGQFKQQDGGEAKVCVVENGWALGFSNGGEPTAWRASHGIANNYDRNNIVADWHGPTFNVGDRVLVADVALPRRRQHGTVSRVLAQNYPFVVKFSDGNEEPFIGEHLEPVDPPEPPPGYQLMPGDYVPSLPYQLHYRNHWIPIVVQDSCGWPADKWDRVNQSDAPHFVAIPIPAPFRISDHGPGVYECRDGRQATVTKPGTAAATWIGDIPGYPYQSYWGDAGNYSSCPSTSDLIRHIGPLPEPWTPTDEWRAIVNKATGAVTVYWTANEPPKRQRKFTRGTEVEWREVTP